MRAFNDDDDLIIEEDAPYSGPRITSSDDDRDNDPIAPTPPPASFDELEDARREVRRIAHEFLHLDEQPKKAFERFVEMVAELIDFETTPPPVWAMRIDTGVGKTRIVVEEIVKSGKTVIYVVPTHRLGGGVVDLFASHGLVARTFRGRMANDPENPGSKMCLNLPAVELALKAHADVAKTCCKYKKQRCRFYDACGYQRQLQEEPQIWIVASDIIFHTQAALKKPKPKALIIDESVWQKSLRGVELADQWTVPFASLANGSQRRRDLADELQMQADDGGLQRKYIEGMDPAALSRMISAEWAEIKRLKFNLYPGMPDHEFTQLQKNTKAIDKIAHARRVIQILEELREMLNHPEIAVSGRLLLDQCNGQRVIRWRGVAHISKQFKVPTLLLDATLPDLAILQVLHPQIEIVADIRVTLPSDVHVRQVRDAPTSSRKLIDSTRENPERHLKAVRRYVLQRWLENGKGSAVVICQQQVEEWLEDKVPDAIEVAHFNAIAGLDVYRDVRLLILVGRVQPGPEAVEALAATLSGSMPVSVSPGPNGFTWYRRVRRGIRLRDGSGIAVIGDQHPDAFVESVRQMICEAELVQALGRARAVNRSAQTPLDVDLLFDTVLPMAVDEVANWTEPSLLIETAAEGVMLESPVDLVRVWPSIWRNIKAANRSLAKGVPALPGFDRLRYQLEGAKMKPRVAHFDREIIPDPRAWLEAHFGPLKDLSQ
jgi:hypothetical protein